MYDHRMSSISHVCGFFSTPNIHGGQVQVRHNSWIGIRLLRPWRRQRDIGSGLGGGGVGGGGQNYFLYNKDLPHSIF